MEVFIVTPGGTDVVAVFESRKDAERFVDRKPTNDFLYINGPYEVTLAERKELEPVRTRWWRPQAVLRLFTQYK